MFPGNVFGNHPNSSLGDAVLIGDLALCFSRHDREGGANFAYLFRRKHASALAAKICSAFVAGNAKSSTIVYAQSQIRIVSETLDVVSVEVNPISNAGLCSAKHASPVVPSEHSFAPNLIFQRKSDLAVFAGKPSFPSMVISAFRKGYGVLEAALCGKWRISASKQVSIFESDFPRVWNTTLLQNLGSGAYRALGSGFRRAFRELLSARSTSALPRLHGIKGFLPFSSACNATDLSACIHRLMIHHVMCDGTNWIEISRSAN